MRDADNIHDIIFLSVVGAYVVRTSNLNNKHSCKLFIMGLRDKIHTHIGHTFNQGQHELCGGYHLLQVCFSFLVSLRGQTELFGRCHLLQSYISFFVHPHGQPEQFSSCTILE